MRCCRRAARDALMRLDRLFLVRDPNALFLPVFGGNSALTKRGKKCLLVVLLLCRGLTQPQICFYLF